MSKKKLPRVNLNKQKSNAMIELLSFHIRESIHNFEQKNNYFFIDAEINAALLKCLERLNSTCLDAEFN